MDHAAVGAADRPVASNMVALRGENQPVYICEVEDCPKGLLFTIGTILCVAGAAAAAAVVLLSLF